MKRPCPTKLLDSGDPFSQGTSGVRKIGAEYPSDEGTVDALIADVIGDIALVLLASWLMGTLARKAGQPRAAPLVAFGGLLLPLGLGIGAGPGSC
jgi:hypothetical protein